MDDSSIAINGLTLSNSDSAFKAAKGPKQWDKKEEIVTTGIFNFQRAFAAW